MQNLNPNSILIILGFAGIVLEIMMGAATGFDLLLIGIIFIIAGVIGAITGVFNYALASIAILSFLYLFVGRRILKQKLTVQTHATNVDALMGKKAKVIKQILPGKPGQIKLEGEIWRAESDKAIDEGHEVVVQSVSGVTLKVN